MHSTLTIHLFTISVPSQEAPPGQSWLQNEVSKSWSGWSCAWASWHHLFGTLSVVSSSSLAPSVLGMGYPHRSVCLQHINRQVTRTAWYDNTAYRLTYKYRRIVEASVKWPIKFTFPFVRAGLNIKANISQYNVKVGQYRWIPRIHQTFIGVKYYNGHIISKAFYFLLAMLITGFRRLIGTGSLSFYIRILMQSVVCRSISGFPMQQHIMSYDTGNEWPVVMSEMGPFPSAPYTWANKIYFRYTDPGSSSLCLFSEDSAPIF